ncbi:MAG: NAD-binding protein [Prochloraceae cyanobacterium]|nr:NAD-binding protein [Prochloraceae cyanobacterium]
MKPQIIVCGLGRTGKKIFKLLKQQGAAVVGINDRPLSGENKDIIIGELRSQQTLIAAGIKEAHTLVIANNDDAVNLGILATARLLNPHLKIVNRLFNQTLGERLDLTLEQHLSMSVSAIAAPIFAFASLGNKAIGQLSLFGQTWPVTEEIITPNHPWLNKKLEQLWDNPAQMWMYYFPFEGKYNIVEAVLNGESLKVGDRIIVAHPPSAGNRNRDRIKKLSRAIGNLQRYRPYISPVILVNLALLGIIALATLTYVCFDLNTSAVDALYFSIGMITGAGGQEQVAETAPDSVKIFTSVMMVVGTGVIGLCYALTNDFILGSRIKQFWDAARVPNRHHYVICGLGIIGLQIARQLHAQGYEVVVVEPDRNNRFLKTVREMGIPVIVDDATFAGALTGANIARADCLIAVTSKDMSNVEIALTAKGLAPKLRVVLRVQEAQLARSMQEVFSFDRVLCPLQIATPSFAAAALGGKVLGNGITKDLLWVALATTIAPDHSFCASLVKDVATEADFVPLFLERNKQMIRGWDLLETQLNSGDILYLAMPATNLDRLCSQPVAYRSATVEYDPSLFGLENIGRLCSRNLNRN